MGLKSCLLFTLIIVGILSHEIVAKPSSICQLPKVVGPCRASLKRYRYDSTTGQCEEFTYGGCKGNENNFITREVCQENCINN
ncbi:kunitz-type serine protease inhibitor HCRG1 [Harpegnathos saltator]|uniref:Four-domain proteases inhibitor n=1 Tax=Harpegnathos saltator TaxID=610380 RepID=E2BB27_HARSA|nr:kunitz-type serine protease inhibitor HCRG1 [Harpegnathos saltator]EFN87118.1 Four-domain proteases inhibitor [Harpegnathos saltator]